MRRVKHLVVLAAWILGVSAAAVRTQDPPSPAAVAPAPQELARATGTGEQCIVCEQPIVGGEVVELRYKGRRFHVASPLLGDLLEDPDRYFAKLQVRSALFDEATHDAPPMARGWLFVGLYVLAGLLFGALCGYVAVSRALPALPWFFAGLVGNVAALVVLLVAAKAGAPGAVAVPTGWAKVPSTHAPVACPRCGETNHPAATRCGACAGPLDAAYDAEVGRVAGGDPR